MSAHSGHQVDQPALLVKAGDGASLEVVTMFEDDSAAATVVRSEAVDWSVMDYMFIYADCFDVCRFNAIFSDGQNEIMYGPRCLKLITDTRS